MNVLALDTASQATAVAVAGPGEESLGAWEAVDAHGRPRHSERVLGLAAELLERAGVGWCELDLVAVGVGPGTYTGLRIGIATARGLALSAGARLVGVGTLRALVAGAPDENAVAVLEAGRGEVFAGAWRGALETQSPLVLAPDALGTLVGHEPGRLSVGSGAVRWRAQLEAAGAIVPPDESPLHRVDARVTCRLAACGVGGLPEPDYLRRADAETPPRHARTKP